MIVTKIKDNLGAVSTDCNYISDILGTFGGHHSASLRLNFPTTKWKSSILEISILEIWEFIGLDFEPDVHTASCKTLGELAELEVAQLRGLGQAQTQDRCCWSRAAMTRCHKASDFSNSSGA